MVEKISRGWEGVVYRKYFLGLYVDNEKYFQEKDFPSIFFFFFQYSTGAGSTKDLFGGTQEINCTGSNRQERDKKMGMTVILGRAELLLKNSRLNIRPESGNNKPEWHLLGYWCKGNTFSEEDFVFSIAEDVKYV